MRTNPNTVKSQDDTTEDELGRTMTLLKAIEQLEKIECELEKVEKQLAIAVKRLEFLKTKTSSPYYGNDTYLKTIYQMCDKTLRQIEELK